MRRPRFLRGEPAGELAWDRPLDGPVPLAPERELAVVGVRRLPPTHPDPVAVTGVQALASELTDVLSAELGPGCVAAPGLTFEGSTYDNRLLAFEVPVAYADRLIDAFAVTRAARRLVGVLERMAHRSEPGGRVHVTTVGAYSALRAAVRGRAGRQQARAALHREEPPVLLLDAHTQAVGHARLSFTRPDHLDDRPVAEVELVGPFTCATRSAVDDGGRHYVELVLRAEVRRASNTEEWREP